MSLGVRNACLKRRTPAIDSRAASDCLRGLEAASELSMSVVLSQATLDVSATCRPFLLLSDFE